MLTRACDAAGCPTTAHSVEGQAASCITVHCEIECGIGRPLAERRPRPGHYTDGAHCNLSDLNCAAAVTNCDTAARVRGCQHGYGVD